MKNKKLIMVRNAYNSSEDILAPCPFCGSQILQEDYSEYDGSISFYIECIDCEILLERQTKAKCIADWNTRIL